LWKFELPVAAGSVNLAFFPQEVSGFPGGTDRESDAPWFRKEVTHQLEVTFVQIKPGPPVGTPKADGTQVPVLLFQSLSEFFAIRVGKRPDFAAGVVAFKDVRVLD
jgi:hypothetical protein